MEEKYFLIEDFEKWEILQQAHIRDHLKNVLKMVNIYPEISSNDDIIIQLQVDYINAEIAYQILMDKIRKKYLPQSLGRIGMRLDFGESLKMFYNTGEELNND